MLASAAASALVLLCQPGKHLGHVRAGGRRAVCDAAVQQRLGALRVLLVPQQAAGLVLAHGQAAAQALLQVLQLRRHHLLHLLHLQAALVQALPELVLAAALLVAALGGAQEGCFLAGETSPVRGGARTRARP